MARIVSTNLAIPKIIHVNGKDHETGIFKKPVNETVLLQFEGVKGDTVADRRVHGGRDKACYLYPIEHYAYWKSMFPNLDWDLGMFGENLTTEGVLESEARIGDEYQIGRAVVQVSQPRQPCFKLGFRFESNQMVQLFRKALFPGIYVRVISPGKVKAGDEITLIRKSDVSITIRDIYAMLTGQFKNNHMLEKALEHPDLAESAKKDLRKRLT